MITWSVPSFRLKELTPDSLHPCWQGTQCPSLRACLLSVVTQNLRDWWKSRKRLRGLPCPGACLGTSAPLCSWATRGFQKLRWEKHPPCITFLFTQRGSQLALLQYHTCARFTSLQQHRSASVWNREAAPDFCFQPRSILSVLTLRCIWLIFNILVLTSSLHSETKQTNWFSRPGRSFAAYPE